MTPTEHEQQVLEALVPQLTAQGYTVYIHPSRDILPPFLAEVMPDAVAFGKPKNLAIEIMMDTPRSSEREARLRRRFDASSDWELRVYYNRPKSGAASLPIAPLEAIDAWRSKMNALIESDQLHAALLIGWATLEALARALHPTKFERAQTPGRIVETLASDGSVTPSEADLLRPLYRIRNSFIHGGLDEPLDRDAVIQFAILLSELRETLALSSEPSSP